MIGVEYSDGFPKSTFPKEWGKPAGDDPYSEERAAWVKSKVRNQVWADAANTPLRILRRRQIEMLNQLRLQRIELLEQGWTRRTELRREQGGLGNG